MRLSLCLLLGTALAAQAQFDFSLPEGSSGYKLLKLQPSARAAGLSGAGSAQPGLGSDQDQNPAVTRPSGICLSGGYASLPSDFDASIQHLSWLIPADTHGTVTGRIRYEGFSSLQGYDEEDQATGSFSASTWTAGLGYAHTFGSAWNAGARVQYAMNTVERYHEWAIVGDLGLRWTPNHPWSFSASLLNIGASSTADSSADDLPLTVVFGAGWKLPEFHHWKISLLADVRHPNDEDWTVPAGIEANWSILTLRAGFPILEDNARPSFGAGISWQNLRFDGSLAWNGVTGMSSGLEFGLSL